MCRARIIRAAKFPTSEDMDMGSQIGSVVGSLVGTYFGGPLGAAIGQQLGSWLGGVLGSEMSDAVGFNLDTVFNAAYSNGFDLGLGNG